VSDRARIGSLPVDRLAFDEALDRVEALVRAGEGGTVFTPNVDHVVMAESDARFRDAYARASLSLADGMPVVWASRLLGERVPAKISGSDFVMPLLERAQDRSWRVFFFGGAPGSAERARDAVLARLPKLAFAGMASPRVDVSRPSERFDEHVRTLVDANADVVLVGLGAPKQELFCDAIASRVKPAVLLGVGASIDFLAGVVPRAPRWMSNSGLEWLYRLGREPRRMWRRYLVRDPKFALVLIRQLRARS